MVRMKVHLEQHNNILPIIEVVINLCYNESIEEELIAYTTISASIDPLVRIVNSCNGKFCSIEPKGKIDKNAKIGVFATIIFPSLADIKNFEYNLGKMFE